MHISYGNKYRVHTRTRRIRVQSIPACPRSLHSDNFAIVIINKQLLLQSFGYKYSTRKLIELRMFTFIQWLNILYTCLLFYWQH